MCVELDHLALTTPLLRLICPPYTGDLQNVITLGFSRSRDMASAHQHLNGSRNLTTPLSWIFCHTLARTC